MYVTDTHPLLWYAAEDYRKLSARVKTVFDNCLISGKVAIYLPSAVVWEISLNIKSDPEGHQIKLAEPFSQWLIRLSRIKTLIEDPVTNAIVSRSHDLNFHTDPFDTLIVATALERDLPLITNDSLIHEMKPCELFWD